MLQILNNICLYSGKGDMFVSQEKEIVIVVIIIIIWCISCVEPPLGRDVGRDNDKEGLTQKIQNHR